MLGLDKLLTRFKESLDKDASAKEAVISCLKDRLGLELRPEDVFIRNRDLRIQTHPAKANEISLHEKEILGCLKDRTKLNIERIVY